MFLRRFGSMNGSVTAKPLLRRRSVSTTAFIEGLKAPVQAYVSTSEDPYLNLSIEHFLLSNSPPDSVILMLYVNRPSIIIGRNQNPWHEVNLPLLREQHALSKRSDASQSETVATGPIAHSLGIKTEGPIIDLLRRRSGGGAVFHDYGNINWSVICPPALFTRNKHAEMVAEALRSLGGSRAQTAKVNARHDIVIDLQDQNGVKAAKISGSAFKITRTRALHHATCLINSEYLDDIPKYLRSPSKESIDSKGIESVISHVANVRVREDEFKDAVRYEFQLMYGRDGGAETLTTVGKELLEIGELRKGYLELKTNDWKYLQSPQFTVNFKLPIPNTFVPKSEEQFFNMRIRHGLIEEATIRNRDKEVVMTFNEYHGQKLHEMADWGRVYARVGQHLPELEMLTGGYEPGYAHIVGEEG